MFWKSSIYFLGLFGLALTSDCKSLTVSPDWVTNLNENYELAQANSQIDGPKELAGKLFGINRIQEANVNDYIDDLVTNLNSYIVASGIDPYELPSFDIFDLGIVGSISLTGGLLSGLNTIERKGDALITYSYPNIHVHAILGFRRLEYSYNYELKLVNLGPDGTLEGTSTDNTFIVDMNLNMISLLMQLEGLDLKPLRSATLQFRGNSLTDGAVNFLIKVIKPALIPKLTRAVKKYVVDGAEKAINSYNKAVCQVLQNCPEEFTNATN